MKRRWFDGSTEAQPSSKGMWRLVCLPLINKGAAHEYSTNSFTGKPVEQINHISNDLTELCTSTFLCPRVLACGCFKTKTCTGSSILFYLHPESLSDSKVTNFPLQLSLFVTFIHDQTSWLESESHGNLVSFNNNLERSATTSCLLTEWDSDWWFIPKWVRQQRRRGESGWGRWRREWQIEGQVQTS